MQTLSTDYSHAQLVDALLSEYNSIIEDGYEEDLELTVDEYHEYLKGLTHSELIAETNCDDVYLTINDFMHAYG